MHAAVKTVEILPTFLYRLFPEAAVQAIVAMVRRARSTRTTFDFTGKGEGDIYSAIESGVCTPEEAKVHINANYLNKAGDQHAALRAEGRAMMKEVREIEKVIREKGSAAGPSTSLHTHGHFRYCLARVQLHVMGSLRANMYVDTGGATTDTSAATSYKSTYQHPKSASDFFEMISLWEWALHATGVADILIAKKFVQDVVFEPIRTHGWSWMMAYCHLLAYLELIEDHPERSLNLSNVLDGGAHDNRARRAEAIGKQSDVFGSLFAVGDQSVRGPRNISTAGKTPGNPNSQLPCISWNENKPCRPEDIGPDGRCSFRHQCGQRIGTLDNGKPKFCFLDHRKCDGCKNPEFKKKD